MLEIVAGIVIGLAGGFAGGLLGLGGGVIFVPAMVIVLGEGQIEAQGVSLTVIVVTAAVAVSQHQRNRTIHYTVVGWMAPVAVGAGILGAVVAGAVGGDALRRIFALVLIAVAVRTSWSVWRTRPGGSVADDGSN